MAITITRDLNVVSVGVPPVIHLSQYDSDFTLVFNLYASAGAFTMPTGTTAEIRGTKRDGNGYDAAASVSGNTVTVTGDVQMTAVAGQNMFEIATYYNNKRLNTINFILDVERAALDADTITSESVLRELDAIIQGAATATQAAEDAEDAADRAEEAADDLSGTVQQVATNTQDIAGLKDDLSNIEGISDEVKEALLNCFLNVEWIAGAGNTYIEALRSALYGEILPEGYSKLLYIEGTGTQYIETNILSQIPLEMTVKAVLQSNHAPVIGAGASDGGNTRFFMLGTVLASNADHIANRFSDDTMSGQTVWLMLPEITLTSEPITVISGIAYASNNLAKTYLEANNERVEADRKIPTLGYPIRLMIRPSGTIEPMRLYDITFTSGNSLIFHGIPALRESDDEPGLYDIVNNVFYTNDGTGEFVYA